MQVALEGFLIVGTQCFSGKPGLDQSRNFATGLQLNTVMFLERMIEGVLRQGMRQEKEYRDIYDLCKSKVLTIKELALLESVA